MLLVYAYILVLGMTYVIQYMTCNVEYYSTSTTHEHKQEYTDVVHFSKVVRVILCVYCILSIKTMIRVDTAVQV